MRRRNRNRTRNYVTAGVFLALAQVLPFITGNIPQIGNAISPMHIPVLILGFVCGWPYGLVVGLIAPLLRSALFGMPALYPNAVAMAFELAAYGFLSGIFYRLLPKKTPYIYVTLIISMILGRGVWGIVRYLLSTAFEGTFTWGIFMTQAFVNALPGIIIHILVIPVVVLAFKRAGWLTNE